VQRYVRNARALCAIRRSATVRHRRLLRPAVLRHVQGLRGRAARQRVARTHCNGTARRLRVRDGRRHAPGQHGRAEDGRWAGHGAVRRPGLERDRARGEEVRLDQEARSGRNHGRAAGDARPERAADKRAGVRRAREADNEQHVPEAEQRYARRCEVGPDGDGPEGQAEARRLHKRRVLRAGARPRARKHNSQLAANRAQLTAN